MLPKKRKAVIFVPLLLMRIRPGFLMEADARTSDAENLRSSARATVTTSIVSAITNLIFIRATRETRGVAEAFLKIG